jgi:adenylate cyclase
MAEERVQRRLAAILAADAAGYSRLMGADEEGTLKTLTLYRGVMTNLITEHQGRVIDTVGDSLLAEFGSAVQAVRSAVAVQRALDRRNADLDAARRMYFRIGINVGDVMVQGADLMGDGVNIAARLEQMAEPGGILVSGTVWEQVEGKLSFPCTFVGERTAKNITRPVRTYRIAWAEPDAGGAHLSGPPAAQPADKPSIGVLPFVNMSGDPEQEYFSDGITEDIITDLSKVSTLNVLSRNTTFTFKGKAVEIGQIAQRLKVGYVVEGSVRKAGRWVRITAQLIDASKDGHVWGERYDRELKDIFALQDEIAQAIVAALKVRLLPTEKNGIENRPTRNPAAYQYYLQGRYHYLHFGAKNLEIAIRFAQRALEIDPQYARAWVLIAVSQSTLRVRGRSDESGLAAAEKALSLDPALAEAHSARGRVLAELGRHKEAIAELEESVRLDPDSPEVRFNFGQTCFAAGRYEVAVEHLERAVALSEESFDALSYLAQIYQALGREDEAKDAARQALAQIERRIVLHPDDALSLSWGAGLFARFGQKERAEEWISRALIVEPNDAVIHFNIACSLAQMSETDRALNLLESAAHKMPAFLAVNWLKNDSDLTPLFNHLRYQALLAREEARLAATTTGQASEVG